MNTVQTEETPRNQGFWTRLLVNRTTPKDVPPASPGTSTTSPSPVGALIAVASVPSMLSLVWTAWSMIDMIPAPFLVGLAAGVVLDIALVSSIVIAWIAPHVARPAKITGWLIAFVAAVLVGYHAAQFMPILGTLGVIPLVAKGLWNLALNAYLARVAVKAAAEKERLAREDQKAEEKRAAEEEAERRRLAEEAEQARQEAELSTELSHERKVELARLDEEAAYIEEKAERELRVAEAKAKAAHAKKVADVRRLGEEQRAMDEEAAEVEMARQELIRKVNASRPASFALPTGEVPSDLSSLPPSPGAQLMGFGSAMGPGLQVSRGRSGAAPSTIDPELQELITYIAEAGDEASVRGAARHLEVSAPTIRRWREKAEKAGLDMSAIKPTT